jgi:hypothetical protein
VAGTAGVSSLGIAGTTTVGGVDVGDVFSAISTECFAGVNVRGARGGELDTDNVSLAVETLKLSAGVIAGMIAVC